MYINTLVSTSIKATSFFSLRVTVFFFPANRSSNSERLAKVNEQFPLEIVWCSLVIVVVYS